MRARVIVLLILLMTTRVALCPAIPPECVFEHYSSLDGLPHNSISDIYKDSKGFIWICTWYGISRFDGYTFRNYRTLPGDYSPLSHNRFLNIREDAAGYLWITSYDNRLYRFDRHNETFTDVPGSIAGFAGQEYKVGRFLSSSRADTWIDIAGHGLILSSTPDAQGNTRIVNYIGNPNIGRQIELIFEDSTGRIFVVSEVGLTLFVADAASTDGYKASLISRQKGITAVAEAAGKVYCAAGDHVIAFNGNGRVAGEISIPAGDIATAIEPSPDGRVLYIGTRRSGVLEYNLETGELFTTGQVQGRIRYLVADSYGTLWITTQQAGITRYRPTDRSFRHFEQQMNTAPYYVDTVTRVVEARDKVWIKMNRVGFGYYDREHDTLEPFFNSRGELFTNGTACFAIDSTNILWMSTTERGLEKITIIDKKAEVVVPGGRSDNRASSEVRALLNDSNGNIWVATKSSDLMMYDSGMHLLRAYPDPRSGYIGMIYAMKEDSQGNIWLGTKGDGVIRMKPEADGSYSFRKFRHDPSDRFSLTNDQIYSIEEDNDGRIWFGLYGGGVCMLEHSDSDRFITPINRMTGYPMSQAEKVRYLLCGHDGMMFAATIEGLLVFDPAQRPEDMTFSVVQKIPGDRNSLGNNDIIHILETTDGSMWFSTFGGGINLLKDYQNGKEPRFEVFSTTEGLSSNIVFAATEDRHGNIWLSTENGISRFDLKTHTFSNFSKYDGIPPASFSEAAAMTTTDGRVLFGSIDNLYIIDPDAIKPVSELSNITFTSFEMDNHEVLVGEKSPLRTSIVEAENIRLPYDYSVFRIGFAALNHRIQPKIEYIYKLEGFDRDWNRARGDRDAYYSNVPYGKYVFRVRSLSEGKYLEGDEASIEITIAAPPWQRWWAYLIYIIVALLIGWIIMRTLYTMITLRNNVKVERDMTDLKLRFFTNISHELRTPLTLILGGVEDVHKREALSDRGEYNISIAEKNAKRMLSLINQLLDFRKIVNEKMEIKVRRADIIPVARSVFDDFREMAAEHGIELLFAVSQPSLMVWIDPQRIEGVIYNLLANAFKFTPDGGRIELSVSYREKDDYFMINVTDSGIGIPRDKQQAIFERFTQVNTTAAGVRAGGSGIGLSLSKDIVEMHHGQISVDSAPGKGSEFSVRLLMGNSHFSMKQVDFAEGEQAYANSTEYMTSHGDATGTRSELIPPAGAQKILLVEDNRELRTFIYNNLIESYDVREAENGADALVKIKEDAPDIIITDLMMPEMDGIELTEKVRGDFETSHIPIIMLTAKNEQDVRTKAMRYGADGYITKPFSMELLLARIDNLLTQRRNLFERYSSKRAKAVDLSPSEIVVTDRDEEFIKNVMAWIDENIENPEITIDQLASHLGMGRTSMYNKIKGLTGKSPVEIIKEYRVTKARMLLGSGQFTVSEAAYKVGFSDPGYFSKCFREQYKMSPAEYLREKRGNN